MHCLIISDCDQDMLKKLQECMDIIISAKDRQAAEANKYASILLEEIDHEKEREERRKAALAKKRDKKKLKKKKKAGQDDQGGDLADGMRDCDDETEADGITFEIELDIKEVEDKEEKPRIIVEGNCK